MKDNYEKLTDVEHVLLRPNTYIGSIDEVESEEYIFSDGKFAYESVKYVPGLLKIVNEVVDNAVDEAVRTDFKYASKIRVSIDSSSVSIEDNGRGIPIEKMKGTDEYIPVVLFTATKSGSNFYDEGRVTAGTNGLGGVLSNIFSSRFKVVTQDGTNKLTLTCKDNNGSSEFKVVPSTKRGTSVELEPDFKRFGLKEFSDVYEKLLFQRLVFLSYTYPQISFWFNKEKLPKVNDKNFVAYFTNTYEIVTSPTCTVAVGISDTDDFKFLSYVNGLSIKKGGNHVKYISDEIVSGIRTRLERKYKNIRPADIRNKLYVFAFFKDFPNMRFDSQTKETLSNSAAEVKEFIDVDLEKLTRQVMKNKEMFYAIEESYKIKQEFNQRREMAGVAKSIKKIKIEKYHPPISSYKYLNLAEGDSAIGGLMPVLGRKDFGYFPLRGKPLNVYGTPMAKILKNEEIKNIIAILQIDISKPVTDMAYENVCICSDADLDGQLIRGGLITLFHRFAPDLIRQGRIKFLNTPIMYTKDKAGTPSGWVYDIRESSLLKGQSYYSKGLGSWKVKDLKHIIEHDGLDNMIKTFRLDAGTDALIDLWMGSSSDARKKELEGLSFYYDEV